MRENRRAAEGTHAQLRGRWAGRHPQPRAPPTGGRRRALGQVPQPLRPPPRAPRRPRLCQTSWPGTSWSRGRHRCAKGSAARPRASLVARQGPGAPGLGLRRGPRPGGPGEASPGVPRSPRPSPVEGELLPATAVAVATLPGSARLRHLQTPGPAAPNKDGGGGACGARRGHRVGRGGRRGRGYLARQGLDGAGPVGEEGPGGWLVGEGGPASAPCPEPNQGVILGSTQARHPPLGQPVQVSPHLADAGHSHLFALKPPKFTPTHSLGQAETGEGSRPT